MVGAVGQGGHPLTVPLGFLFPGEMQETPLLSLGAHYWPSGFKSRSVDTYCTPAGLQDPVGAPKHPKFCTCLLLRLQLAPIQRHPG